ncbi:MAG: hypothetical protein Q8L15_15890 [Methylobacter sp.]|nr:hypothetical protein [Methylobacter sp.]
MATTKDNCSYEEYVRRNRVFVLGAGFSVAAGVPLTNELIRESLKLFSTECPGIYSRVENHAKEAMGNADAELDIANLSFSDLCTFLEFIELREYGGGERWSENGSREKLALRYYLAKTLVARTPKPEHVPELYRAFAAQLHAQDVVMSFNWDGLLEAALEAVGMPYTYDRSNDAAVHIYKLHGSVNWLLGEPNLWGEAHSTLPWQKLDFHSNMMDRAIYSAAPLLQSSTWIRCRPLGEVDPYIVLPGYGKAFDVRANAPLWYKPEAAFACTHNVYIIGLSLAHDDFFVRSLFLSNLPYIESYSGVPGRKIVIVNPSPEARKDYAFILHKNNVELWNESFSLAHVEKFSSEVDA